MLLLRTSVPLTKEPTISFKQSLSPKIDKQEGSDKIIIHWENHVTVWSLVFLTLFAAVFLFMLVSFAMNDFGKEVFPTVILSFIFLVFCFVMGFTVKTTVKNLTTRFAVDKSNLEYYEFSRSSGKMRNSKSIPLAEIQHVAYSFAPSKSMGQNGLKLLTAEDVKHLKEIADKPLEAVKEIFSNKNQPLTLSIMALNPVECLQLENWLQELILKKGNQISKNL